MLSLPTSSPLASIVFGILFVILIAYLVWWDSQNKKLTLLTLITGVIVVVAGVMFLYVNGSYG